MKEPVSVLLVIGVGCPHCRVVMGGVCQLVEEGEIASLEVIRADSHPERVEPLAIRSVPWMRIGPYFELEGGLSLQELRQWVGRVGEIKGMAAYFDHLFSRGQRHKVEAMVRQHPDLLHAFVLLLADPQVGINTRLGVGVVLEEVADTGLAAVIVHGLGEISRCEDPRLRGDACHYLPLTGSDQGMAYLQARLDDPHPEVREIARESLEELQALLSDESVQV